ncbi:MAG: hypothetical protein KTV77_04665 [Wolbachia endosymbiont of Fragariocoptes setiger]|nr:hypothetical protein [Wolbachia endosymbiont of Fragariocoptes setiger]
MNINRIKSVILIMTTGVVVWTANSALKLGQSYLQGGNNHYPMTINNGGTLSGGDIYIDSRSTDFSLIRPYMMLSFSIGVITGAGILYHCQNKNVTRRESEEVQVNPEFRDIALDPIDQEYLLCE